MYVDVLSAHGKGGAHSEKKILLFLERGAGEATFVRGDDKFGKITSNFRHHDPPHTPLHEFFQYRRRFVIATDLCLRRGRNGRRYARLVTLVAAARPVLPI